MARSARNRKSSASQLNLQVEFLEGRVVPAATMLDLTTASTQGMVNGALFQTTDIQPTGTGVINSFVRIQTNRPVEQGYNTDARPLQLNENNSPQFTRSIQIGDVPVVEVDGVIYREFLLDINQTASSPLLSLDQLRLYVGNSPNLKGYNPTTKQLAGLNPVFDLDGAGDAYIKLNYNLNHGSGSGDIKALIPDSVLTGTSVNNYLYLYSRFGDHHANNSGFEEWAVQRPAVPVAPPPTPASLSGYVYSDLNNDGIKQDDEPGIAGATVTLTGTDDLGRAVSTSTATSSSGAYSFGSLRPGTYLIAEDQPDGYLDGKDTIGTPGGTVSNDRFSDVVLAAGVNGRDNNFGELTPGVTSSLSGYVYADLNNDGIRQLAEPGIAGATVTLTGTDDLGNAVDTRVTTDTDGAYTFGNLRPGTYLIAEEQPSGYLDGKDTIGTPGGTVSNDRFSDIALAAGVNGANNNFGELPPASLSGQVYGDLNNDGVRQIVEPGVANVMVTLSGTDDLGNAVNVSTTTDSDGAYTFGNLRPGTYLIAEQQPEGYFDGKDTIGTPGGTIGNDRFSDIVLNAGFQGRNNNFGEILSSILSGFVYEDANENGVMDEGEIGIPGVEITLIGFDEEGNRVERTVTTQGDGFYVFFDVKPGTYRLVETQPEGAIDGRETVGSLGGIAGDDEIFDIRVTQGSEGLFYLFGEFDDGTEF